MADYLTKEDYEEPRCLLCEPDPDSEEAKVTAIPTGRVIEKLDAYLDQNDYDSAERHLLYWIGEATVGKDDRGLYTLYNEMMGLYRKLGLAGDAIYYAEQTLALLQKMKMDAHVTAGTAYVNVGTVYKAFGKAERGLPYFEKAKKIYEAELAPDDARLAGLYNNMALALCDLGRYDDAQASYEKAFAITVSRPEGAGDAAITLLNLANLVEARDGLLDGNAQIMDFLDRAEALLNSDALPRDGYYAFVCEKCASTFGYYGYFAFRDELLARARRIYEGA